MISGKNLKKAIKDLNLTQQEAAERLEKSRATVITWIGKAVLDEEIIHYINKRLGISLQSYSNEYIKVPEIINNTDIVVPDGDIVSIRKTFAKQKHNLIPFYGADFMAGRGNVMYDDDTNHPEYYMDIPEFSGCIAFRAFGDSMENIIKSSSILFGLKLDDDWRDSLEYGQIYGITMKNGLRYLKYIRSSTDNPKEKFLLKSENNKYDDFEIRKDKVKNIWLIQGWIDKRA